MLMTDFSKFERPALLHVAFQALDKFQVRGVGGGCGQGGAGGWGPGQRVMQWRAGVGAGKLAPNSKVSGARAWGWVRG